MTNNPGELEFPLDWEFRIIAFSDQLESVKEAARCCLLTVDPDSSIDVGKASGAGSYTALRAKSRIASRSPGTMMEVVENLLRVLVLMIAPLVIIAAFVECYVTPVVMSYFA